MLCYPFDSWVQKNPECRDELIRLFKKAGYEQGLVGLKPIAILAGENKTGFDECVIIGKGEKWRTN